MSRIKFIVVAIGVLLSVLSMSGTALAVDIKLIPDANQIIPGQTLGVNVVLEDLPATGLSAVQFRLRIASPGGYAAGVSDLNQADTVNVSVAAPLNASGADAYYSGLGEFMLGALGSNEVLLLDNQSFSNETVLLDGVPRTSVTSVSALYSFALTSDSGQVYGDGTIARFMIQAGAATTANRIDLSLSDVVVLDADLATGPNEYPLANVLGSTVALRCNAIVPDLSGADFDTAQQALLAANLLIGSVGEIDNSAGTLPLGLVLEQSVTPGTEVLCESVVNLAINTAPADVTSLVAIDTAADDTGKVQLSWTPSALGEPSGYRVYRGDTLLLETSDALAAGAEIAALANGVSHALTVKAYDAFGNESVGTAVSVVPLDDVPPMVTITGVDAGTYYPDPVNIVVAASDTNLAAWSATLNGQVFSGGEIAEDGDYILLLAAEDASGNRSEQTVTFTMDRSAPLVKVSNLHEAAYYNADLIPEIVIEDANLIVAATSYLLDGKPYPIGTPVAAEGPHALTVSAGDKAGNATSRTINFIIDKTAPVITIVEVADAGLYNVDVTPMVVIDEDYPQTSGISLNGIDFISGTVISSEESYLLLATAVDMAGNTAELSRSFVIDKTAPLSSSAVGSPSHATDGQLYVSGATEISLNAVDLGVVPTGVAVMESALSSSADWLNYSSPLVLAGLVEGEQVVRFRASDRAGNLETDQELRLVLDKSAPVTGIEQNGVKYLDAEGRLFISGTTSFSLKASDNLSGTGKTEYRIDAGDWAAYTPFDLTGLPDGEHRIGYRSTDLVLNEESEKILLVARDSAAPVSVAEISGPQYQSGETLYLTAATSVGLSASDNFSGIAATEYRIDGGDWSAYAPFALTALAEGQHSIGYRSVDMVANLEREKELLFVVDNSAPVTVVELGDQQAVASDGSLYVTAATNIGLSATDNLTGVKLIEYRIDGGAWTSYLPFNLSGLADGEHRIGYRALDNLDNLEIEQSLVVIVDNSAPVTNLSVAAPQYLDDNLYVSDETEFTLTAADNLAGVAVSEYRIDSGDWTVYAPFALTGLADGPHSIGFRSVDSVNNVESEQVLHLILDNTAPLTAISVADPQYVDGGNQLYVAESSVFTLEMTDNLAGVASSQYRIDKGAWADYEPFSIDNAGLHQIDFRSLDRVANLEETKTLYVLVDSAAPITSIDIGQPMHSDSEGSIYVASATVFSLDADDDWVGVAKTEYRIDNGAWTLAAPFGIVEEGEHLIDYRSIDHLGNLEETGSLRVTVDNSAPITQSVFEYRSFFADEVHYISRATGITLPAADALAGAATTYYRYDNEMNWRTYAGAFRAEELVFGSHVLHYYTVDNVDNSEEPQSRAFTLVGAEVNAELLNLPRVLVWTEDPEGAKGNATIEQSPVDVRSLIAGAMGMADAYVEMVTDKDLFQTQFRSGIFNVVMIVNQDVPFSAGFLREIREAVARGSIGLLVSSWGNNVHPVLQEVLGIDFVGSMSLDREQRELYLFDSEVSSQMSLSAYGRILKTRMAGGTLAGLVPAENQCNGIESLSFNYPESVDVGSLVRVSAYTRKGKRLIPVDDEQAVVSAAPFDRVNDLTGNPAGDVAISSAGNGGVTFTLAASFGHLESEYLVAVKIEGTDGSVSETGPVAISPTCGANLMAGMDIGPFRLLSVFDDKIKVGEDLAAVVLNEYGDGRAMFLAYNIIDSAMNEGGSAHANLLGNAANYLLPVTEGIEPAGIGLVETKVSFDGAGMDLLAVDTLAEGLTHLPLFDLTRSPLEYSFTLEMGEEATYRYFVRFPDRIGDYLKQTDLSLKLEGRSVPFDNYAHLLTVSTDSGDLLLQAMLTVEEMATRNLASAALLDEIAMELQTLAALSKSTSADYEVSISAVIQIIQKSGKLPFATDHLREILADYLRIMQALETTVD
jgi:hypothetical protein